MSNKGFTLIELLAVIVILAIIALIATPIILGIINNAKKESQERSIELYATAVKNGIALSQLKEGKSIPSGKYTSETLPFEVEYDGDIECSTIEIYEDGTIYVSDCAVNKEKVEYKYGKNKGTGKPCTLQDLDKDGKASLSDIVTCGTESFYVMTNENNEITMLSMYNLDVGNVVTVEIIEGLDGNELTKYQIENPTNMQNKLAKGGVVDNSTWYGTAAFYLELIEKDYPAYVYGNSSNLYQYVNEYERILKEDLKVISAEATLISYKQLVDLGCDKEKVTCGPEWGGGYGFLENPAPEWVYSTSYWSGSSFGSTDIWFVGSNGLFDGGYHIADNFVGVRPVVTISTSEI